MDIEEYLILVKSEDQTAQIQSLAMGKRESKVYICYLRSPKQYSYFQRDVQFFDKPNRIEITERMVVYCDGIPAAHVERLLDFGPKVRVIFKGHKNKLYNKESVWVETRRSPSDKYKNLLKYWKAITSYTSHESNHLVTQYEKLTYIHSKSVLSRYLDGIPGEQTVLSTSHMIFPFRFNLSQKAGVAKALSNQISVIEGPPGTGKTQTILNILANLVMQNQTVAVVSSNNAAVENVAEKLKAEGYGFLVASLGNKDKKEKFFANLPQYDVSAWKSEMSEPILLAQIQDLDQRLEQLLKLEKELVRLKQQLSSYKLEREHFNIYYAEQNVEQIRNLSYYRETPQKVIEFLADNHRAKKRGFLYKCKLFLRYGFTDFKMLDDKEIDVILGFQKKYYDLKIEHLQKQLEALQSRLDQESFQSLLEQHQSVSKQLFRHRLYQKYHDQQPIQTTKKKYKSDFASFVKQFPILTSTTHSLRNCIPDHFLYDYLIIDEASQVDLATGVLALSCCKNVLIVGDTKQLPQIVDEKIRDQLVGVDVNVEDAYDYFKQNLLSSMLAVYPDTIPKVMLKEHYRCHPRIIDFCNQKYYDGELIAYTTEKMEKHPLVIYHTVEGNHMREVTRGKQLGKYNARELDVIRDEILRDPTACPAEREEIGFVTPYRKQVAKAMGQLDESIQSDTVHKYQGREKPVMIFSTVLDNTMSGKMGLNFLNDPQMINVAVSRAQKKFILVTDRTLFRKVGKNNEIGDLIRYMEYSTTDDNVVQSEIVSVFDLLYKDFSEKLRAFQGAITQDSKYQSENIMRALLTGILQESTYAQLEFGEQILLRNLLRDAEKMNEAIEMTEDQRRYVNNRASVDFVLYHKLDKSPILVIEVDGFSYHENSPEQLARDEKKNLILESYGLPLLRLPTNGSGEEQQIKTKINEILDM